ncbi:HAMP domain-containing sensor histidine kinase [Paenibacillus taichungensis]|uniref:sensor histidine kinase n=1 Tax=Paenibacillus taichungensis TaxID=484184 RepID=UPI002DB7ED15|nr:HAMP domain-containing sensor histidine kinase [Paenibacillus taichungensis]MEC0106092.1 HAMP domain-containing sensor histidine kinase [Paenibacillus taichungensis]MEC0196781.1 HAMP domain-containing sensor histidine kinase [Paenibacillus taichungensis]
MKIVRESLRLRIVVTFFGIVIVSLILSFILNIRSQENTPNHSMVTIAEDIATMINLIDDPEKVKTSLNIFARYGLDIHSVNEQSEVLASLPDDKVHELFDENTREAFILSNKDETAIVGVPRMNEEKDALLIKINFSSIFHNVKRTLFISLLTVLVIGSLLIMFMSGYIVKPIKRLTAAAKKMASGDLSVRLKHNNPDEFGELMESFNHMARELQKIDSVRDDFVSNVSHEMQSPLTSIRGFTRALQDGVIPLEEQKEHLDIIYEETLRLSRLSDNLLRLASLDSEHHPFNLTTFQLDEQLRRTIVLAEPQWANKNIRIDLDLLPCEITVDKDLFEQVWQNLINNAIKYTGPDGVIHVAIEMSPSSVKVSIRDSGQGIPEEDLPYIFDRFYMVDKARSSALRGNGLGLSIVIKILKLHDCTIDVDSRVGEGTQFTVTIPRPSTAS